MKILLQKLKIPTSEYNGVAKMPLRGHFSWWYPLRTQKIFELWTVCSFISERSKCEGQKFTPHLSSRRYSCELCNRCRQICCKPHCSTGMYTQVEQKTSSFTEATNPPSGSWTLQLMCEPGAVVASLALNLNCHLWNVFCTAAET